MKILKLLSDLLNDYFLLWVDMNQEVDDAFDYYEKSHRLFKK